MWEVSCFHTLLYICHDNLGVGLLKGHGMGYNGRCNCCGIDRLHLHEMEKAYTVQW